MKILGIAIVFVGCSLCGFMIDGEAKKRIKQLEQFIYSFELLKAEIDYRLTPLEEACEIVGEFSAPFIKKILNGFSQKLKSRQTSDLEKMWKETITAGSEELCLSHEDFEILYSFGKACGYLDKKMQSRNIDMLIEKLKQELKESKEKYHKTSKLNKSLGILIGACMSIFLI